MRYRSEKKRKRDKEIGRERSQARPLPGRTAKFFEP